MVQRFSLRQFGDKLRDLRVRDHMTLTELAVSLGYRAHGHLSEIEAGKKNPTIGLVVGVAQLFNVSTDSLLLEDSHIDLPSETTQGGIASPKNIPFVDRSPYDDEIEIFRLILSTYQDGTGMLADIEGKTLPGWRDFERSVALAFKGAASENKDIFDVRIPDPSRPGVSFGISCKMRSELNRVRRDGRVTIELSNASRRFWDHLGSKGIDQQNYKQHAQDVGVALIELLHDWHRNASSMSGGDIDLDNSFYLTLMWNKDGSYQLHKFDILLPDPHQLNWYFPTYTRNGVQREANHIRGDDSTGIVFEWYGESGGQLKYYPLASRADWESELFTLQPLPNHIEHGMLSKAREYFGASWP